MVALITGFSGIITTGVMVFSSNPGVTTFTPPVAGTSSTTEPLLLVVPLAINFPLGSVTLMFNPGTGLPSLSVIVMLSVPSGFTLTVVLVFFGGMITVVLVFSSPLIVTTVTL